MAKRKPASARTTRPATWFTQLGAERAAEYVRTKNWTRERVVRYQELKRASEREYLLDTVLGARDPRTGKRAGGLRDYFKGFDTEHGYDMRHPERLTAQQAQSIHKYGSYLHTLQSQPHIRVAPRTSQQRRALQDRTGQFLKRQKKYAYHVERPDVTKVTFRRGVLEEREQVEKTEIIRQYYFFRDFNRGQQPKTFRSMVNITEKRMLPVMPDRYYTFWTDLHGAIGAPFPKKTLLRELQRYENQYGGHKGFAEGLLGFVFQGTSDQADSEYVTRLQRRSQRERQRSEKSRLRQMRLRFLTQARKQTVSRCEVIGPGGRCRLRKGHKGLHRF